MVFKPTLIELFFLLTESKSKLRLSSTTKVSGIKGLKINGQVYFGTHSEVLISSGCQVILEDKVRIGDQSSLKAQSKDRIYIGHGTSLHGDVRIIGNVEIGSGCLFARNIFMSSYLHHFRDEAALPIRVQDEKHYSQNIPTPKITVGDDCWVGWGVVISPGVTIGKGAIIGANSVVTKDVPPYTIVGGVPAKPISKRLAFDPPQKLHAEMPEHFPYFYSGFSLKNNKIVPHVNHVQVALPLVARNVELKIEGDFSETFVISEQDEVLFEGMVNQGSSVKVSLKLPQQKRNGFSLLSIKTSHTNFQIVSVNCEM